MFSVPQRTNVQVCDLDVVKRSDGLTAAILLSGLLETDVLSVPGFGHMDPLITSLTS